MFILPEHLLVLKNINFLDFNGTAIVKQIFIYDLYFFFIDGFSFQLYFKFLTIVSW